MKRSVYRAVIGYASLGVLAAAIVLSVSAVYLLFFDTPNPITYNREEMIVSVQGDSVVVTVDYCRRTDKPFTAYVSFTNDIIYNIPPEPIGGTLKGCGVIRRQWPIPAEIPDGRYYLTMHGEMRVNFLTTRVFSFRTEEFTINRYGG